MCAWSSAQQAERLPALHVGTCCSGPGDARLMQDSPKRLLARPWMHRVPRPGLSGNGILLLLLGTVAGAAAESILGGAPSPSITH